MTRSLLLASLLAVGPACDDARERLRVLRDELPARFDVRTAEAARIALPSDSVLASLREQPIVRVKKGGGGRSLSFKVTLGDGTIAYFKPDQSFAAHWYSEVAAFHIDRMLELNRVAPVASRKLPWSRLSGAAGEDYRVREVRIGSDGAVRGALIAWIDGKLVPAALPDGWEAWLRIDAPEGASPFQRVGSWRKAKQRRFANVAPHEPDRSDRPAELSDLVLFDYLIGNLDRWGGNFTNVRTLGKGGPLVYLDNANGFHKGNTGRDRLDAQLEAVQRFRKKTIEKIRDFDVDELEARLAREPAGPILDREQLDALEARRQRLLEHVAEMQRRYGADAMPW